MELTRRSLLVYALLLATWVLVVGWQAEEHRRVNQSARTDLRNRSKDIANTLSAFIRGVRFRGAVSPERLEPVLSELVNGRSNELVKSSQLISIVLLNAAGEPIVSAGRPLDPGHIRQEPNCWHATSLRMVNRLARGLSLMSEPSPSPPARGRPFRESLRA